MNDKRTSITCLSPELLLLRYTNAVAPYYTAKHPRAYYTNEAVASGVRARELIKEALVHLKGGGFDFSGLTADDGEYVYALNVFYAGPRVNNWAKGLWPHSYHLLVPDQLAPGRLACDCDYQITNMGSQLTLGTFCHENGHMICDFPDLYDLLSAHLVHQVRLRRALQVLLYRILQRWRSETRE